MLISAGITLVRNSYFLFYQILKNMYFGLKIRDLGIIIYETTLTLDSHFITCLYLTII